MGMSCRHVKQESWKAFCLKVANFLCFIQFSLMIILLSPLTLRKIAWPGNLRNKFSALWTHIFIPLNSTSGLTNILIAVAANAAAEEARKVAGITNNLGGGDASDCPCAALMETGPESWGLEIWNWVWHFVDCGGTQISETNNGHRLHGRLD